MKEAELLRRGDGGGLDEDYEDNDDDDDDTQSVLGNHNDIQQLNMMIIIGFCVYLIILLCHCFAMILNSR